LKSWKIRWVEIIWKLNNRTGKCKNLTARFLFREVHVPAKKTKSLICLAHISYWCE
jgi:hypothetical protein